MFIEIQCLQCNGLVSKQAGKKVFTFTSRDQITPMSSLAPSTVLRGPAAAPSAPTCAALQAKCAAERPLQLLLGQVPHV